MKKCALVLFLSLGLIQSVFAYDTAKLHVAVTGSVIQKSNYFLCLPGNVGCVNLRASKARQSFPIDTGKVDSIFTANMNTYKMYTQTMPASCQVDLKKDQTLTVSGQLVVKGNPNSGNSSAYINNLHCTVA